MTLEDENNSTKIEKEIAISENKGFVMELLSELKLQNKRLVIVLFVVLALWAGTIGGFIWYLNQYDYTSTIEQNGVYTLIDSQGNVISSDISPEQMEQILEVINNGKD